MENKLWEKNHDSPESLENLSFIKSKENALEIAEPFEDLMDINPNELKIKIFSKVPDYIDPLESAYPIIARNTHEYFCLDGWQQIERAKEEKKKIRCRIFHFNKNDEVELALFKAAIRMVPLAGLAHYAEIVRNVRILFDLLSKKADIQIYYHGGDRRSKNFTENKEENIRLILEKRLGRKRKTINKYLSHGEYLMDNALDQLVKGKADKDFFEKFQQKKREILIKLKSSGASEDQIITEVSKMAVECLGHPEKLEENSKEKPKDELQANSEKEKKEAEHRKDRDEYQESFFRYWGGNPDFEQKTLTEGEIRQKGEEICKTMLACFRDVNLSSAKLRDEISKSLAELHSLINFLKEG